MKDLKLHLGCGKKILKGWINVDLYSTKADIKESMIILESFSPNTVSEIYTSHAVEHIDALNFVKALKCWHQLLIKNGILIIRCPNFKSHLKRYLKDSVEKIYQDTLAGDRGKEGYLRCIFGYQTRGEGYKNRNIFTKDLLIKYVEEANFKVEECREVSVRTRRTMPHLGTGGRDLGLVIEGIPVKDLWCRATKGF